MYALHLQLTELGFWYQGGPDLASATVTCCSGCSAADVDPLFIILEEIPGN
jgi:hypothetical protein